MPMTRKRQQQLRQQQQQQQLQQQQQQLQRPPSQSTTNQQPQLINLISSTPEANQQRPMSVDNKQVKMNQSPGSQVGSPPGRGPARQNNRRGRRYNQKKVKQNNHNKSNSSQNSNNNNIASSSKEEPTTALIIETALQKDVEAVLENDLTCAICREVYINPLILNCSHSFCKFCLTNWLSKQSNCASCRMVAVFQTENLALRNVINKMIQGSSEKYKEERAVSVKSRLEAEEKQQQDGIVPMMAKDNCSRSIINGRGLVRRRAVISPWNGSNGATIWRTNLRNNNEAVQHQARDDYSDDNSSVDSIGDTWQDDALRDVYGNFGDSDDEDDDDYYEEVDHDNDVDEDDIMEEDDDDDDDLEVDDDEVMDSEDDEVDDILSAGMGEIVTTDSDTAQSYPSPANSSSEEESGDEEDDDDDVAAHDNDDDDDDGDSDNSYSRTLRLSLFTPFLDPTRHMYSSSDNDSDSDFHVEVVDDSRISPIIQSPSPSTSSSSSSSNDGIHSSWYSSGSSSSNGGNSDTNRNQGRFGQINIRPTSSERYITVDITTDEDDDDFPIISWNNRIETRSRRTRPRD